MIIRSRKMQGFHDVGSRIKLYIAMLPFFDRQIGSKASAGAPETAD